MPPTRAIPPVENGPRRRGRGKPSAPCRPVRSNRSLGNLCFVPHRLDCQARVRRAGCRPTSQGRRQWPDRGRPGSDGQGERGLPRATGLGGLGRSSPRRPRSSAHALASARALPGSRQAAAKRTCTRAWPATGTPARLATARSAVEVPGTWIASHDGARSAACLRRGSRWRREPSGVAGGQLRRPPTRTATSNPRALTTCSVLGLARRPRATCAW